jgi:hypothetical protein
MAKTSRTKKQRHLIEQVINPNAAGIDIGATEMVVAVPSGRDTGTVRSFGTLTPDLHDLCGWLQRCNITSVAMESTGVHWMPLFGVLRKAGLEVLLVNAAQVRHCPARTLLGQFKSEKHFASWLGLCPDNRKSGGKILASRTRQVANRLAGALRLSAQALWQSKSNLGDWCRKMKARLGKAEGITATAHRIARIIYHLVAKQAPYDDNQIFQLTPQAKARRVANLQRQAQKLGLQIMVAQ